MRKDVLYYLPFYSHLLFCFMDPPVIFYQYSTPFTAEFTQGHEVFCYDIKEGD